MIDQALLYWELALRGAFNHLTWISLYSHNLELFPSPPPKKSCATTEKKNNGQTQVPKTACLHLTWLHYSTNFFHGVTFFEGNPPHHPTSMETQKTHGLWYSADSQPSYCGVRNGTSMCRWNTSRDQPFSRVAITRPGSHHKQCQMMSKGGMSSPPKRKVFSLLVGGFSGFNSSEKYIGNLPQIEMKIKIFETTT